jgi:tetratricopeptide (TPR) repeat protein
MKQAILAEPILVGRERELKELQRCLDSAVRGKGSTVFVSGEAGSGKTRLIAEFLDTVKKKEVSVLSGWCLSNATQPYFPFVEAFESYLSTVDSGLAQHQELKSWFVGYDQAEGREITPQVWKDQTFAAITKELLYMSTNKPIILFIDDIHWADSASLALIHYIARSIRSEKVLVIATYRSEKLFVEAEGQPHPLLDTLRLMRREDLVRELAVTNLGHEEVLELAKNMLGGDLQVEFADKLVKKSQGNPLFVVESVRMLHEREGLVLEANHWRLKEDRLEIPTKIKDLILQRLSVLTRNQRRLLDVASVIGERFRVEILASVLDLGCLEVTETLDEISRATSLVCCEEDQYRFDHARSRDAIYEEMSPTLRMGYHAKIAEKLECGIKNIEPTVSEIAYHYTEAGNKEKSVEYVLAAAKDELKKWSNVQAIKHFEFALQIIPEGNVEQKETALEGLGDAYSAICMYGEAIKTFDKLAKSKTGLMRLHAIRKATDVAFDASDRPDLLLEYAQKALELGIDDRLEMARIIDNRGWAWSWSGRGEDVRMDLVDYDAALKVFEEENSFADVAEALCRSGMVTTFFDGLREKGLCKLLRSRAMFRELGDVRKEAQTTKWVAQGFLLSGLYSEAAREYSNLLRIGEKLGFFNEMSIASWSLTNISRREGKLDLALSQSLKELEYSNKTDSNMRQGNAFAQLTLLCSLIEDLKEADKYFDKMSKLLFPKFQSSSLAEIPLTLGIYFAAKGRWAESDQAFQKQFEFYKTVSWPGIESSARKHYAWALEKQGRLSEAKVQKDIAQKLAERFEETTTSKFGHANVLLALMAPRKVEVGKEFEMRLDLVNVAKNFGTLIRVEGLIPDGCKVTSMPIFYRTRHDSVDLNHQKISAFEVKTVKLKALLEKEGAYRLEPSVIYVNELGETRKTTTEPITIAVQLGSIGDKFEDISKPIQGKFAFESVAGEKTFNFLVSAFEEDYTRRRLPEEKSGWRTLMEVVRKGHVSKYSMYGQSGRNGAAILELKNFSLVESRFFLGERGRSGQVLKIRINYQNENVRQKLKKE